jgi:hypothetical protein
MLFSLLASNHGYEAQDHRGTYVTNLTSFSMDFNISKILFQIDKLNSNHFAIDIMSL